MPLPTLQAGEAQATPPIGIGIKVRGSSPALAALFLPLPALVAATQAFILCPETASLCVCVARALSSSGLCLCVGAALCYWIYVVCERSQTGLKSFYLGLEMAIFSSRGSAPHPAGGHTQAPRARPPTPEFGMTHGQHALYMARQHMQISRTDAEIHQVVHTLALALGATWTQPGTRKALIAVLILLEHPEMSEQEVCASTGASSRTFKRWQSQVLNAQAGLDLCLHTD